MALANKYMVQQLIKDNAKPIRVFYKPTRSHFSSPYSAYLILEFENDVYIDECIKYVAVHNPNGITRWHYNNQVLVGSLRGNDSLDLPHKEGSSLNKRIMQNINKIERWCDL